MGSQGSRGREGLADNYSGRPAGVKGPPQSAVASASRFDRLPTLSGSKGRRGVMG